MNVQDAALQILKDAGKPLHAKEIAERIIEAGLWSSLKVMYGKAIRHGL
jgi:restriction system protein